MIPNVLQCIMCGSGWLIHADSNKKTRNGSSKGCNAPYDKNPNEHFLRVCPFAPTFVRSFLRPPPPFVRSLCATFCGDQNPQKPANCYKLHPKSLGTTCLQSSVHVGLILTFDLTFYPFGFTALVLQHHELIGQALVPKHLQWKCIAGLCRWIQRF